MGADRTIDDLQRARAALESMYARRGYGATQVLLPEQEIKDGVVQPAGGGGEARRDPDRGESLLRRRRRPGESARAHSGEPLATGRLATELRLANENPGPPLPRDLQTRVRFTAQYTSDMLLPGEQFGLGGMDSVRGFFEREFTGDKGFSGSVELYSPELVALDSGTASDVRVRLLAFYDYGRAWINNPQVLEQRVTGISSVGPGVAHRLPVEREPAARLRFHHPAGHALQPVERAGELQSGVGVLRIMDGGQEERDWSGSRLCRNAGGSGVLTRSIGLWPRRLHLTPRVA